MQTEVKARKLVITEVVEPSTAPTKAAAPPAASPPKFEPTQMIKLALIEPDPHNPRKDFPKEAMQELTASVALRGVLQAITVRPVAGGKFRLVYGERRYRAAKAAGLDEIKAEVRNLTDIEAADIQLEENLRRVDLAPLEIAGGYQRQLDLGRTIDQVCERAGKKRSAVYAMVQLLQLGDAGRKALGEEKISTSVAQLVARVPKTLQDKALGIVQGTNWQGPLSFRQAEAELAKVFTVDLKKAPFDTKDAKLCPAAGACGPCPKRAGNAPDLFPDIKNADTCTDRACYDAKVFADMKRVMDAKGLKLLSQKEAPPDEVFWHGDGPLKDDSYLDPATTCYDDTQNRSFRDLLPPEQFKKLAVVVLDSKGKAHQLLPKTGIARELKKGGIFKEKTKRQATAPAKQKTPGVYKPPPPSLEELVDTAVMKACVEVVEKKGLTPAIAKLIARELVGSTNTLDDRRGIKHIGYGFLSEKEFDKTFGKLSPGQLAGLLFDATFDRRISDGDDVEDLAKELGVDVKKVAAAVELANAIDWVTKPGIGEVGKGDGSGTKFEISKEGKTFALVYTPAAGGQKGIEKQLGGLKSLDLAKAEAARVEQGMSKKGAGK